MNTTDKDHQTNEDEVLETLFRHGTSRARAPAAVEADIRQTLHREWLQQTRRRRSRNRVAGWAIAASVVLSVFLITELSQESVTALPVAALATAEKSSGDVFVQKTGGGPPAKLDSDKLLAGDQLSTIEGSRIALRWANGESVRLDQNSRIELISASEIRLLSGKVYVDSADAIIRGKAFRVLTPQGQISHIGTQYIIEIAADGVYVSVREGEVAVAGNKHTRIAKKGQLLQLSVDGQEVVTNIPLYGENWQWTEKISPGYNMDGRSLQELLDWVSHETGLQVRYASTESRIAAAQTQLHGQVDLEPIRALELLLPTSDLRYVLNDGVILVTL